MFSLNWRMKQLDSDLEVRKIPVSEPKISQSGFGKRRNKVSKENQSQEYSSRFEWRPDFHDILSLSLNRRFPLT